jgi:hypothetical protein
MLVLSATATFGGEEAAVPGVPIVPPGREKLLADMLGMGVELPECAFAGAQAEEGIIRSHYACPAGEVTIELRHPSRAPNPIVVTERFAIVSSSGTPPPELTKAIEARIRARESGFEWTWIAGDPGSSPPFVTQITHAGVLILVVLVPVAVLGGGLLYSRQRRKERIEPRPWRGVALAATSLAALVLIVCVHSAFEILGRSFAVLVKKGHDPAFLRNAGLVISLVAGATVATAVLVRVARTRGLRAWGAVVILAYVAIGCRLGLLPDDLHYFGPLSTFSPNSMLRESVSGSTSVTYRLNRLGFRKPEFEEEKPDGILRIVLIGDSFVFGTGVDYEGTLAHRLASELNRRFPAQGFEVLNLGIPGDNLSSHVELYRTAIARLDPDVVVLCLTLVNDLSRWDEQAARRDARRMSPFSLVRFLAGDAVEPLWALMFLESSLTPAGLDHLDRELSRLEGIRRQSDHRHILALFGFSPWVTPVAQRLEQMSDIVLVPNRTTVPEEFIPGDGHPTSIGNSRSAAHIADALAQDSAWQRLLAIHAGER